MYSRCIIYRKFNLEGTKCTNMRNFTITITFTDIFNYFFSFIIREVNIYIWHCNTFFI